MVSTVACASIAEVGDGLRERADQTVRAGIAATQVESALGQPTQKRGQNESDRSDS